MSYLELAPETKVKMVNCLEAENYCDRIWRTKGEPWQLGSGEWIVRLEGFIGGFAVKYLERVKDE